MNHYAVNAVEDALYSYKKHVLDFARIASIKVSDVKDFKFKKFVNQYSLSKLVNTHGIYLICEHGSHPWDDVPVVFYCGQTLKCFVSRIKSHCKSLRYPEHKTESTGRSFSKFMIDSTQIFDIYVIHSEILGITTHEQSIMSEKAYQDIFDVIVKDTKYIKLT